MPMETLQEMTRTKKHVRGSAFLVLVALPLTILVGRLRVAPIHMATVLETIVQKLRAKGLQQVILSHRLRLLNAMTVLEVVLRTIALAVAALCLSPLLKMPRSFKMEISDMTSISLLGFTSMETKLFQR